jgi:glycosyltransferase involved in cell wall biosynthesis
MLCLAEKVPIVYVEPTLSATSVLKNWRAAFSAQTRERLRRCLSGRAEELAEGIHVTSLMVSVPPHRISAVSSARTLEELSRGQHRRLLDKARRIARQVGMRSPVLWASYPTTLEDVAPGDFGAVVYDCMDRWTDFPDVVSDEKLRALVEGFESRLLETADVVFCSAKGLYDAKAPVARGDISLVRNGADTAHFAPAGHAVPADLAALPGPVVGYVGAIAAWVDFELIGAVARQRPDWSIALIGPVFQGGSMGDARELDAIAGLPNVHLMGPRPYADLPGYLEGFDVATIPFKLNGLTDDTNPIKVYEYLAAGVPVVSTALPEVLELPEVGTATTAEEFVAECERAILKRRDESLIALRMATAEENSWRARADAVWRAVLAYTSRGTESV